MANEFTAVVERDDEWFIAYCPEIPGAYGQGRTKEEALESLSRAVSLILEDRREDGLRGVRDRDEARHENRAMARSPRGGVHLHG
jgi:predicted RNase H-like HicB family nuclease